MAGNQAKFQKLMNQGHSAAWDQLWGEAAEFYKQALEEFPNHPMALNSLGLALFESKDYTEAFNVYLQATHVVPNDPIPLEKIAQIFEYQEKTGDAVLTYMKAADLHLKAKDVDKSIDNWHQVLKLQPYHRQAHTKLALVHERLGHRTEAVNEYLSVASLMQRAGENDKALQIIDYALKIMPDNVDAQQARMLINTNQNLTLPAQPQLEAGAAHSQNQQTLPSHPEELPKELNPIEEAYKKSLEIMAGLLFDQAEDMDSNQSSNRRALGDLSRGLEGSSPNQQANKSRIMLHLGQIIESQTKGQNSQAAEELERAMAIGLNDPAAHFNLGYLYKNLDEKNALLHLQNSAQNPDFALASQLLIGEIYRSQNNTREAASAYLRALSLADAEMVPEHQADDLRQLYEPIIEIQTRQGSDQELTALCTNIDAQLMKPNWRKYLKLARQELPEQPADSMPLPLTEMLLQTSSSEVVESLAHIRLLTNQGKFRSAMEEAFRTLKEAPTYLPLHIQIGKILLREGHLQAAIDKFLLVARLYSIRGEANQAIQLLLEVAKATPMDISVRIKLVEMLMQQGRMNEAIDQYMELANIYYQQAELNKARKQYENGLQLAQSSRADIHTITKILYKMADIDQQRLNFKQAIQVYEQICQVDPADLEGRVQLVELKFRLATKKDAMLEVDQFISIMLQQSKRYKAIEFMEELIRVHPQHSELRNRLAELYIQDGKIEKAVEQFDALADECLKANNRFGAISMVQKIISLDPPNIEEYRTALAQLQGK